MHRELTEHIGNTLLDMFGGGHYGFGSSQDQPAGTFSFPRPSARLSFTPTSTRVRPATLFPSRPGSFGRTPRPRPKRNSRPGPIPGSIPSRWPVRPPRSLSPGVRARGTVSGTLAINDPNNPGTSPVSLWIGLAPVDGGVDFQQQYLTYQFWVKTGAGGSFTIPNIAPGTYNLWAFGPGVVGTFEKANVTVAAGRH